MTSIYGDVLATAGQFVSHAYHSSAVLGNWVYIDGGELIYNTDGSSVSGGGSIIEGGQQKLELLTVTLALDLSSSWTNDSVTFRTIPKDSSPILNSECLWPNAQEDAAYVFGGELSFQVAWPNISQPQPPALWKLSVDGTGSGQWSKEDTSGSLFPASIQPTGGMQTSGNGVGYYLGGYQDFTTYPQLPFGTVVPLLEMIEFNSSTGAWSNLTSTEVYSVNSSDTGQAAYGGAHFVESFGPEGLVVFFGNTAPVLSPFLNVSTPGSMTEITIFEPLSATYYIQKATGPSMPTWRANFCTTGVAGDNGTYEIVIHAGTQYPVLGAVNSSTSDPLALPEQDLDQIYILSLPSFAWFQADYVPIQSRTQHTCHTVGAGGRQMLVIGGLSFNQTLVNGDAEEQDRFTQGLGVFDLTDLEWKSSFDPNTEPYSTPEMIKDYIAASGPDPHTWDDPRLAQIFAISRASTTAETATSTPSSKPTPVGAIAGGVVGGVVGLILLCVIGFFLFRRKQKSKVPQEAEKPAEKPAEKLAEKAPEHTRPTSNFIPRQELEAGQRHELLSEERKRETGAYQGQPSELEAREQPSELEGRQGYTKR